MKRRFLVGLMSIFTFLEYAKSSVVKDEKIFKMNGIFSINSTSGHINSQSGVMMAEAMKYAVQTVNSMKDMHGNKLVIEEIFDSSDDGTVPDIILKTFLKAVPFLIGPYSSETSYIANILTGTFKQIAVSYSATYSDFDTSLRFMTRSVPSDAFRLQALLMVIKELNWNYVGVISSFGYNGERESLHFVNALSQIDVCVATQIDLKKRETEEGYINAIQTAHESKNLKALVLFTTLEDSRSLLHAIKKLNLADRFYMLCVYGCTNYIEVVKGVENEAFGMFSLDVHSPEIDKFKEYYLNLKVTENSTSYFKQFWEETFNCSLKEKKNQCTGNEQLGVGKGYYTHTPVHHVIDAVLVIAKCVKFIHEGYCMSKQSHPSNCSYDISRDFPNIETYMKDCIKQHEYGDGTLEITNHTIKYDVYRYRKTKNPLVGSWKIDRTTNQSDFYMDKYQMYNLLNNGTLQRTKAVCSHACPVGYIKIRDSNIKKKKCCWTCHKCPDHNIALNDTCIECKVTEKPNHELSVCTAMPRKYIRVDQTESWLISTLSVLGLASVMFVTILFIKFNDNRIVRASGRDLCYLILLGIFLTFLCPFMFLLKPTVKTCLFRGGLPGLAFICCYAPLFLRTNRIYRIFFHAKISVSRPALVSSQSQLIVSCGIVAIQMLLVVVWFVSKMPAPQETVALNNVYVNLHCKADDSPILLVLNLALSVIFMISCTILAFKTRHFPKNYNEAKYIGVTLYLSCVSWAVFFPAYFLTNPKTEFLKEYLMCAICIAIGYITLFGLFGQKIRLLLFQVQNGNDGDPHPTWYLSDSESSSYKPHNQLVGTLSSHPTQDTLM